MLKTLRNIVIFIMFLFGLRWMYVTNTTIEFSRFKLPYHSLPENFEGFTIAHLSDVHNTKSAKKIDAIYKNLRTEQPDIIAITGDLIDSRVTDVAQAVQFLQGLREIAPCYYVTGNHESRLDEATFRYLIDSLTELGVVVLRNDSRLISRDGEKMSVVGVDDPQFKKHGEKIDRTFFASTINELAASEAFTLLLSHRPEFYAMYNECDVNLVLTGHAHGGQVRLPFIGGLFAPSQGFFPKYDAGVYKEGEFAMVVSRGVGDSIIPVRFNNSPEVVIVELQRKYESNIPFR